VSDRLISLTGSIWLGLAAQPPVRNKAGDLPPISDTDVAVDGILLD